MTNEDYIRRHREEDVRRLALAPASDGVDLRWCLQQIEGWQLARRKLPRWAATEGLWYPARLALEQCSSQDTAEYKQEIVGRLIPASLRQNMTDLTGGLGVDFSYLAPLFWQGTYVEVQPELCRLARHNLPLLGLPQARVVEPGLLPPLISDSQLVYIDPARRDTVGRKTVTIQDCSPNLAEMQETLLSHVRYVVAKLSPMLDIRQALRQLSNVSEIHVVSLHGECKELLFVMQGCREAKEERLGEPLIHCVNLGTADDRIIVGSSAIGRCECMTDGYRAKYLYEPNASVLKAGVQDVLCQRYPLLKLHPMSHLFVGDDLLPHFPGRCFCITGWGDFSKSGLRTLIGGLRQANLTIRNFPTSVAALRRQLRLSEGGNIYLFATTVGDGRHVLIRCEKVQ